MKKYFLALSLALSSALALPSPVGQATQASYVFAVFMPRDPGDTFWDLLGAFMQAACEDLGVKLQIHYGHGDAKRFEALVQQAVSGPDKVDAVFFQNFKESAPRLLQLASEAQVPAMVIDSSLNEKDSEKYGKPREHFAYWVGDFVPDNEEAGLDLALELLRQARSKGLSDARGKTHLLALAGETDAGSASYPRVKGLKLAMHSQKNTILEEIQPAFWNQQLAKESFLNLYSRYPAESVVVWAANDPMALGALEAGQALKLVPGKNLLVGGIDWTEEAQQAIQSGRLSASVGGHFMLGGWAAILVYDYLRGIDFAEESAEMRLRMDILSQRNIDFYVRNFGHGEWGKIDFKRFSKSYSPQLKKYDFGLNAIIAQLQTADRH